MRDVRERINLLEQDQRRSAEVVRELQSQSQAATVAQLTEDVSSLRKQLALANRESQRRAEQDRERLDAMADQLQAVCEDALQNRADHERTSRRWSSWSRRLPSSLTRTTRT
jgi:chromosome segregation ATPase